MPDLNTINEFNRQIEVLQENLNNVVRVLNDQMLRKLQDNVTEASNFTDAIQKGEDVTKKLSAKLDQLQKESNRNSTTQLRLERLIEDAKRRGNTSLESRLKTSLFQQRVYQRQIEQQQTLYNQLLQTNKAYLEQNSILSRSNKAAELFSQIGLGNLVTFQALLQAVFKVDQQIVDMGKSLGVSYEMAEGLREEMNAYVRASNNSFINTERLFKAQMGLTEQLGIAVDFGNEEREIFARLTEITGLAANEAGNLAKFSAAAGISTKEYVSNVRVAANEAMRANKIHISDKELLSSVSKLSAGILVKFQNNPKALASAVVQAKALGTSLEQIDKTAESLLNFESSIGAELEAELITGRQLNFERARAAALTGDQVTLMEEMAAQAGSLAEYQNMNVIAQQSLAQAFGMSREEMSEMLLKQEAITKYGDEAAKLNAAQLEDMQRRNMSAKEYLDMVENQRSTQEKFNDILLKMQETFANIAAGPLGTIMKMFASIAENAGVMYTLIAAAAGIMAVSMANSLGKTITQLGVIVGLRTAEAAAAVTTAQAMTLGFATIGIIGGLAAVMGALSSAKKADDMESLGYGKRIIFSPEGAISLNNNDTIVAGTNLGGGDGNNNGIMNAINNLASSLSRQPAPQFALNVDGERIGSVVGRQQSTGTQQVMGSYKLA